MKKMFKKSFQAKSFREFWWYWNPVYGFYLSAFIFKPLRKIMPQNMAFFFTFAVCGLFLHDIPIVLSVLLLEGVLLPFPGTIFFSIVGLINVLSIRFKLKFDNITTMGRVAIHFAMIIGSFIIALAITIVLLMNFRYELTIF